MNLKKTIMGIALIFAPLLAMAQNWPVTVTDLDNRSVTIPKEPQRIILQDGRDILALALLERDNPLPKGWPCTTFRKKLVTKPGTSVSAKCR